MKSESHIKKHLFATLMIVLIIVFDRITKQLAVKYLSGGDIKAFIPSFIDFHYMENDGIAFSFLSGASWLFTTLTVIVCIGILYFMYRNKAKSLWLYWSLGVVVSGGIGNLVDRVAYGYVVDFIEPTFVNFAVFNIADCAVTCGAVSLIGYLVYDFIKSAKEEKKNE